MLLLDQVTDLLLSGRPLEGLLVKRRGRVVDVAAGAVELARSQLGSFFVGLLPDFRLVLLQRCGGSMAFFFVLR